jgi:hypothetical protein
MLKHATLLPGAGFDPGRAALYYLQRLAVLPGLRHLLCGVLAAGVNLRTGRPAPPLAPAPGLLKPLQRDGLAALGTVLTPGQLAAIHDFLKNRPLYLPRSGAPVAPGAQPPLAAYGLTDVLTCPHLLDLANGGLLLAVLRDYFGCLPTISGWGLRWSRPTGGVPADDVQVFHRDLDDWRTVKLFVYLTDVDERCGPHVYALGSHREAGSLRGRPLSDAAAAARYGTDRLRAVCGPAGTAFLADTHGYHKGAAPVGGPRLMLTVQYTLLPVFLFAAPAGRVRRDGYDRYVNRLFLG